eukprot:SAG22_NODE_8707_length_635_cov_1.817164_1_plen_145_part_01
MQCNVNLNADMGAAPGARSPEPEPAAKPRREIVRLERKAPPSSPSTLALLLLISASAAAAGPVRFHVAPTAGTSGESAAAAAATLLSKPDGSPERPFATLHQAQKAVRAVLGSAAGAPDGVEVSVAAGRHELAEPLRFTSADSGS